MKHSLYLSLRYARVSYKKVSVLIFGSFCWWTNLWVEWWSLWYMDNLFSIKPLFDQKYKKKKLIFTYIKLITNNLVSKQQLSKKKTYNISASREKVETLVKEGAKSPPTSLVLMLLQYWCKSLSLYLVPVPNYWTWTKTTLYRVEIMITSLIETSLIKMELPKVGRMITSAI